MQISRIGEVLSMAPIVLSTKLPQADLGGYVLDSAFTNVEGQHNMTAPTPPEISFQQNVARGIIRARSGSAYEKVQLVEVFVLPRRNSPPASAYALKVGLKLTFWDPESQQYLCELPHSNWGEWGDPVSAQAPATENLQPFLWNSLRLDIIQAGARVKQAGYREAWSKVTVRRTGNEPTPNYSFWQARHEAEKTRLVSVEVSAVTGTVKPIYESTGLAPMEKNETEAATRTNDLQ